MSIKSKTYCPYPFIGASLQPDNMVLPCGQYMNMTPFKEIKSIDAIRNNDHMCSMRDKMLNNQADSGCQCYVEENVGLTSMRQASIEKFGYQEFGKLKLIELFFNNVCNLKCRMCASPYSHLWFDEELELYGTSLSDTKYTKNTVYNELDLSELELLKIYGGEPLFGNDADLFFKKLKLFDRIDKLSIELSTNGTILPKENVDYAFQNCKSLDLNISIDAYGSLNNFIRSNSNFSLITQNLSYYSDLIKKRKDKHTNIKIHSALSVYNVNEYHILKSFINENYPNFYYDYQLVQYPVFLNIKNLPNSYKEILIENIEDEKIRDYLKEESDNYFDHFLNFHNTLNDIRKEKFSGLNLLLENFINKYISNVSLEESREFFIKEIDKLKG
jgi:MoaA/NifB/PqqE/SkfB family radical SAM enzyme